MFVPVTQAIALIESRGLLERRRKDDSARMIDLARSLLPSLPADLEDFYRANIRAVGEFPTVMPTWNDHVGWRGGEAKLTDLLHVQAAPLFGDGCGDLYGLDLAAGETVPAVYFFDHEDEFSRPHWAAGSSLGAFLLLLAEKDQAFVEKRPSGWELVIDPDIDKCPRAPAIWNAG